MRRDISVLVATFAVLMCAPAAVFARTWPTRPSSPSFAVKTVARPATAAIQSARSSSAKKHGTAVPSVQWTFGGQLELASLSGAELYWQPLPAAALATETQAVARAIAIVQLFAQAFTLSVDDTLVPLQVSLLSAKKTNHKRWAVALARHRLGIPVAGQSLVLHLAQDGAVVHLMSSLRTLLQPSGVSEKSFALADSVILWLSEPFAAESCHNATLAYLKSDSAGLQVRSFETDAILATQPRHDAWSFDLIVTSRDVPNVSHTAKTSECVSSVQGIVTTCADTGTPVWASGPGVQAMCCQKCLPSACSPECIADPACTAAGLGESVKAGVLNAGLMRERLAGHGITSYENSGNALPCVISPYGKSEMQSNNQVACNQVPQLVPNVACTNQNGLPIGNSCQGAPIPQDCAAAFYPREMETVTCNGDHQGAKGVILMSDNSKQALDVMAHEFGHLWLGGHGFGAPDPPTNWYQAMAVHESVSDQLAILVDDDDWNVGELTACSSHRRVCAPWCGASPSPVQINDSSCAAPPLPPPAGDPTPACKPQPFRWEDFEAFAPDAIHYNGGITNFAAFLFGTTATHTYRRTTVPGQGKAVLGQVLKNYPASTGLTGQGKFTFEGHRGAMIASASVQGPAAAAAMELAMDAVAIWRSEGETDLFGVGKVALYDQETGTGTDALHMVNWNGVDRNVVSRCEMDGGHCHFSTPVTLQDTTGVYLYPAGPPAGVRFSSTFSALIYPSQAGQLVFQAVTTGAGYELPQLVFNQNDPGNLVDIVPGIGVGAAWHPDWGSTDITQTLIAWICDTPNCACDGQTSAAGPLLCVRDGGGQYSQVVAQLVGPADYANTPSMAAVNGNPVVIWSDEGKVRYAVRNTMNGVHSWQTSLWVTKGSQPNPASDFSARTTHDVAGGVLLVRPPAESRPESLFIQYYPDVVSTRAFAFAAADFSSAVSLPNVQVEFGNPTMGVAQNKNATSVLDPVGPAGEVIIYPGGFVTFGGRHWAMYRRRSVDPEPFGPYLEPIPRYGPIVVKSLGW